MTPVQRIQENILANKERQLLNWLCARLPAWVNPDLLTSIGFFGMLMVFAGYALSFYNPIWLWFAILGYFVNWFGDSLDGSLARFRKIERPLFGYFVDHSTDALGNLIALIGLGLSPYVRLDVALFAIAGYLLLSIHTFLAARVIGEFRLTYMAGGPTELRIILIIMAMTMYFVGPGLLSEASYSGFDIFAGSVGIILIILFIIQTWQTARILNAKEKQKAQSCGGD
jgi:archaetidylinositol phosphate synthase